MRHSRPLVLVYLSCAAIITCASPPPLTGIMEGRVTGKHTPPSTVVISWEEGVHSNGGKISTTLATGEQFTGQFVRISSSTSAEAVGPIYGAWGPVWGPDQGMADPWYAADATEFVRLHTGQVVATFFGDRGNSMRCRFQVSAPEVGLSSGGVGECQTSNGLQIAVKI